MFPEVYEIDADPEFCALTNPEGLTEAMDELDELQLEGALVGFICIVEPMHKLVAKGRISTSSIANACPLVEPPFPVSVHCK